MRGDFCTPLVSNKTAKVKTYKSAQEFSLEFLQPHKVDSEVFPLSSGDNILIQKYFLTFTEWKGAPIKNSYGNKVVVNWNDEPLFAELAVLKLFTSNGWSGVWVDSYRRKYRVGLPDVVEPIEIPEIQKELINSIRTRTTKFGGCWDLFLWKDGEVLFVELKRKKKDRIQDSQRKWLEHSLAHGLSSSNFAFIEWEI